MITLFWCFAIEPNHNKPDCSNADARIGKIRADRVRQYDPGVLEGALIARLNNSMAVPPYNFAGGCVLDQ